MPAKPGTRRRWRPALSLCHAEVQTGQNINPKRESRAKRLPACPAWQAKRRTRLGIILGDCLRHWEIPAQPVPCGGRNIQPLDRGQHDIPRQPVNAMSGRCDALTGHRGRSIRQTRPRLHTCGLHPVLQRICPKPGVIQVPDNRSSSPPPKNQGADHEGPEQPPRCGPRRARTTPNVGPRGAMDGPKPWTTPGGVAATPPAQQLEQQPPSQQQQEGTPTMCCNNLGRRGGMARVREMLATRVSPIVLLSVVPQEARSVAWRQSWSWTDDCWRRTRGMCGARADGADRKAVAGTRPAPGRCSRRRPGSGGLARIAGLAPQRPMSPQQWPGAATARRS